MIKYYEHNTLRKGILLRIDIIIYEVIKAIAFTLRLSRTNFVFLVLGCKVRERSVALTTSACNFYNCLHNFHFVDQSHFRCRGYSALVIHLQTPTALLLGELLSFFYFFYLRLQIDTFLPATVLFPFFFTWLLNMISNDSFLLLGTNWLVVWAFSVSNASSYFRCELW